MATESNPNHAGVNRRRFLLTSGAMGAATMAAGMSSWPAVGDPAGPGFSPPQGCGDPNDHDKDKDSLWLDVKGTTPMHPGIGNGNIAVVQPDPKKNAYAVHHGGSGKYDLLIIPVTRVTGVECGALTGDTFLNLWPHAFKEAQKRFPGADVIAGINSVDGRTKNQLHIHLTAFFNPARKKLDELNITTKPVDWNKKEAMHILPGSPSPPNPKAPTVPWAYRICHVDNAFQFNEYNSRSAIMTVVQNFIDGKLVDSVGGATMPLVDPATGDQYGTAPVSDEHDIDNAYAAAATAFSDWKRTTPSQRQKVLLAFADELERSAAELVEAEGRNTGKPNHLTMAAEIPQMLDQTRFFAGAARVLEGKSAGEYLTGHMSWIRREPVGVIGQVTPWNYPMMMAIWKFVPAIAAGNTVVIKPSDTTPVTTVMLAELASRHLPPGVLNIVTGDRTTGAAVVAHRTPQMVSITGSVTAGRAVAESAGGHLKRTHLELGGKAPVIVFGDADIAAAEGIAASGYFNAGQDCTAATRVLGHASVADDLTAALAEQARNATTTFGRGADDEDAWVPPVNNADQLQRVLSFLVELPDHASVTVQACWSRLAALGYPGRRRDESYESALHLAWAGLLR